MTEPHSTTTRVLHGLFILACFLGMVATDSDTIKWLAAMALAIDGIVSACRLSALLRTQQELRRKNRSQGETVEGRP
jgi:isoprenylcysteine carboxyl methyltransferase (ICMT) family protein YpbQ